MCNGWQLDHRKPVNAIRGKVVAPRTCSWSRQCVVLTRVLAFSLDLIEVEEIEFEVFDQRRVVGRKASPAGIWPFL